MARTAIPRALDGARAHRPMDRGLPCDFRHPGRHCSQRRPAAGCVAPRAGRQGSGHSGDRGAHGPRQDGGCAPSGAGLGARDRCGRAVRRPADPRHHRCHVCAGPQMAVWARHRGRCSALARSWQGRVERGLPRAASAQAGRGGGRRFLRLPGSSPDDGGSDGGLRVDGRAQARSAEFGRGGDHRPTALPLAEGPASCPSAPGHQRQGRDCRRGPLLRRVHEQLFAGGPALVGCLSGACRRAQCNAGSERATLADRVLCGPPETEKLARSITIVAVRRGHGGVPAFAVAWIGRRSGNRHAAARPRRSCSDRADCRHRCGPDGLPAGGTRRGRVRAGHPQHRPFRAADRTGADRSVRERHRFGGALPLHRNRPRRDRPRVVGAVRGTRHPTGQGDRCRQPGRRAVSGRRLRPLG